MILTQTITVSPLSNTDIFGIIHRNPKLFSCDSKTKFNDYYKCENAITPYHIDHYCSNYESSEQWLDVSFPSKVKITNYTIMSTNQSHISYWSNPKSWQLFGFDESGQHLIHSVSESGLINGDLITKTFPVDTIGIFTKVRFILGESYSSSNVNYILRIHKIDFFGTFKSIRQFSCLVRKCFPNSFHLIVFFLL